MSRGWIGEAFDKRRAHQRLAYDLEKAMPGEAANGDGKRNYGTLCANEIIGSRMGKESLRGRGS